MHILAWKWGVFMKKEIQIVWQREQAQLVWSGEYTITTLSQQQISGLLHSELLDLHAEDVEVLAMLPEQLIVRFKGLKQLRLEEARE